jgi:hypothetical protein
LANITTAETRVYNRALAVMTAALFTRTHDARFAPSERALGPWGESLHGGPVAGLLAQEIERAEPRGDFRFVRLTVDLFRAVPRAELEVSVNCLRDGRRIQVFEAILVVDGNVHARAVGVRLRAIAGEAPHIAPLPLPLPGTVHTFWSKAPDAKAGVNVRRGFHTEVDGRRVRGDGEGFGAAWFRLPFPLADGMTLTPFVRTASVADFANGLAARRFVHEGRSFGYINADLTLNLLRYPEGEWVGIEARNEPGAQGSGLVRGELYDERGGLGVVTQVSLANPRGFMQR